MTHILFWIFAAEQKAAQVLVILPQKCMWLLYSYNTRAVMDSPHIALFSAFYKDLGLQRSVDWASAVKHSSAVSLRGCGLFT